MNFGSSGISEVLYYKRTRRSANNGVIDQHNPLALQRGAQRVHLHLYGILPLCLGRENKASTDISVLHEAGNIGQSALQRVSHRGVQSAVRRSAYDIGLHRMLPGQDLAHINPRFIDALPVDHGIRSCEIDEFKDTQSLTVTLSGRPR